MRIFSWVLEPGKFLSGNELARLIDAAEKRRRKALRQRAKSGIREWFVMHLALNTGLRVMEIRELCISDLKILEGGSSLLVRRGKNGRPRVVQFSKAFLSIAWEYLSWKKKIKEPFNGNSPLFYSARSMTGKMSTRALQKMFERCASLAGVTGHSINHLRHTYASYLYKASDYNLRLVQKQLGHSSIKTTEVYAHVLAPDVERAVNKLYEDI